MSLSVVMFMCLGNADQPMNCMVVGLQELKEEMSVSDCEEFALGGVTEQFLTKDSDGFYGANCYPRKKYAEAIKKAMADLRSQGHKVVFEISDYEG